jgi:two-component system response regulator HydG
VVGRSPAIQGLYRQIRSIVSSRSPALVTGETGVGKEHIVRILHASSDRRRGPLQIVNCAAIPSDLLEAELFGIERGVATGVDRRLGKLRLADKGVLFLDEVGDMDSALQAKLLRALQDGEAHPVGAASPVKVDVRVVAATNVDLESRVRSGDFRKDLYYRIAGCELRVPALRQRREDIPALVDHFLHKAADDSGKSVRGLSVKALADLQKSAWPGNIRQLQREIERLVATCPPGQTIESSMISPSVIAENAEELDLRVDGDSDLNLKHNLERLERRVIAHALDRSEGNQSEAARLLGVTRTGLTMKMKRLGIELLKPAVG